MLEGVSVIMPCYNGAKYLREAVDSVLAQEYDGPLEILVADDGSTDNSVEIARSYGPPVVVLMKPPSAERGVSIARNRCIRLASHPFIAFLDSDDVYLPGHLQRLATTLTKRPDVGLVYDLAYMMSQNGEIVGKWEGDEDHPEHMTPDYLLLASRFGTGSVMVRRSVFEDVGYFNETFRYTDDHDMWLRVIEKYSIVHVPSYGFMYRQHGSQNSLRPVLWLEAKGVLAEARRRYPYRRSSVRKRQAVIDYRLGQLAIQERYFLKGGALMFRSAIGDPLRAVSELRRRCLKVLRH